MELGWSVGNARGESVQAQRCTAFGSGWFSTRHLRKIYTISGSEFRMRVHLRVHSLQPGPNTEVFQALNTY